MTFTYRYRKQIMIGVVFFILLIGGGSFFYFSTHHQKKQAKQVFKVTKKDTKKEQVRELEVYKVDLKGEVVNPGIYTLSKDSRVMDAITEAGGLTENADTSVINLSKKISDEMVIIVYSYEEVRDFKMTKELEDVVQKNCMDGGNYGLENDACIGQQEESKNLTGKISINSATQEELQMLPGIGEAKAKAIIEYRDQNGPFQKIEDLQNVSGIGENVFAQIKENITT